MNNPLKSMFGLFRPTITPQDPTNRDSEVDAGQMLNDVYAPSEEDLLTVRFVKERFQSSSDNRRPLEGPWFEGFAFYLGNQWVQYSRRDQMLRSVRDPKRPHRVYATRNKIRPLVKKLLARALKSKPDASVRPLTLSALDRAAAAEARALLAHLDNKWSRQNQVKRMARYALTTSTVFLKLFWDPTREVEVPIIGPDGSLTGSTTAQVGDIVEFIVTCFEVYPDPSARSWNECGWIIHAKMRHLSYIQERYANGKHVRGDADSGPSGYVESRLASVVGEFKRGSEPGNSKKQVLVIEMWELPTPRYPQGRLITIAGDVLLRSDPWPYKKRDTFPFVPLSYEEGQSTLFGLNAVNDLISPQQSYNKNISMTEEHRRTSHGKIMVESGSEIGPDAFDPAKPNEVIEYRRGSQLPVHVPASPLPSFLPQLIQIDDQDMRDISGVHDVSDGGVPAGVTAGNAIQMLQESDTTQMADFIDGLETFHVQRATWEISLASQYYREPRLVMLSQAKVIRETMGADADPDEAAPAMSQVQAFQSLASGGSCHVVIRPGSATPKSQAAVNQLVLDLYQQGFFGPQGDPRASIIATKLLEISGSDEILDDLLTLSAQLQKEKEAQTPNPLQQQQAAMMAQQQDQQHEQQMADINLHTALELADQKHQHRVAEIEANKRMPNISLSGIMDGPAIVSGEHMVGLNGSLPAQNQMAAAQQAKTANPFRTKSEPRFKARKAV